MTAPSIANPVSRYRGPVARGLEKSAKPRVEREGGDRGAGIIRGVSAITVGEALGHRLWVDGDMVRQTAEAIRLSGENGIKMRFAHPSLSGDGIGKFVGRMKGGEVVGDKAVGDLHFDPTAHNTPEGDLAEYLMDLAESDPAAFGASIAFQHDLGAEELFEAQHKDERGAFRSPDPRNKNHYSHARIAKLKAVDVVDSPAANPEGLFHASAIPAEADALLSFILGESDEAPELGDLGVDPDRARSYVSRYLAQRGLSVTTTNQPATPPAADASKDTNAGGATAPASEATKPAETNAGAATEEPPVRKPPTSTEPRTFSKAELDELFSTVGPEMGAKAIAENLSFGAACKGRIEQLTSELNAARNELAALKKAGATFGSEPASGGVDREEKKGPDAERVAKFQAQLGDKLGEAAAAVRIPGRDKASSN